MKCLALLLVLTASILNAQDSATIYYRLADTQYKNKQRAEAKLSIEKSIRFHPTDSAYFLRAKMQGETDKGFADMDTAIRLNPLNAAAYVARGSAYLNYNYEKSRQDLLQAARLWPDSVVVYDWLGLLYWEYEYYNDAITNYSKAIKLSPETGKLYDNRGRVKMAAKEYASAIDDFNAALKYMAPDKPGFIYHARALCKHYMGDKAGCCEDLNKAMNTGDRSVGNDYKELCVPKE